MWCTIYKICAYRKGPGREGWAFYTLFPAAYLANLTNMKRKLTGGSTVELLGLGVVDGILVLRIRVTDWIPSPLICRHYLC
jgi:energy-converting hydrogenase Eha subunit A